MGFLNINEKKFEPVVVVSGEVVVVGVTKCDVTTAGVTNCDADSLFE
jgi:hypothetical protein